LTFELSIRFVLVIGVAIVVLLFTTTATLLFKFLVAMFAFVVVDVSQPANASADNPIVIIVNFVFINKFLPIFKRLVSKVKDLSKSHTNRN
jgi:hypothetical protein